uniref:Uncharacterized protein n=1 Tax=Populus trichocarpa TaxID=3694 RepID=A0A3N7FLM7_POPTR
MILLSKKKNAPSNTDPKFNGTDVDISALCLPAFRPHFATRGRPILLLLRLKKWPWQLTPA